MINKILFITSIILLIISGILLTNSSEMTAFTNEEEYEEKYMQLTGGEEDSQSFYELREEYLTPKYKLEDYGILLLILGLISLVISFIKVERLRSPSKWWILLVVGIFAAILTIFGYVGDLFLEMSRGSYPHWSDSLAIPLMGTPVMLMMAVGWALFNLSGTKKKYQVKTNLFPIDFRSSKKWYLVISTITILLIILGVIEGYYWQSLSEFLWLYFYLSIMQGILKKE